MTKNAAFNLGVRTALQRAGLCKEAILPTMLNPGGHLLTRLMSESGDPAPWETGEQGAWTGAGRGITHGLGGAGAGDGAVGFGRDVVSGAADGRALPEVRAGGRDTRGI